MEFNSGFVCDKRSIIISIDDKLLFKNNCGLVLYIKNNVRTKSLKINKNHDNNLGNI